MPISIDDYAKVFRKLPILITFEKNGEEKQETLNIKYKPLNEAWVDRYNEIQSRHEHAQQSRLEEGNALAVRERALAIVENPDSEEAKAERAKFDADIENYKVRIKEDTERHKKEVAGFLSDTLIDVDMVDGEGKPVKPTAEFLVTLDFELLSEINTGILKKTFRAT